MKDLIIGTLALAAGILAEKKFDVSGKVTDFVLKHCTVIPFNSGAHSAEPQKD